MDPGNGGKVGVWTGSGNPEGCTICNQDEGQFIAAGPAAGVQTRIRMKFEHRDGGTWVSCSHVDDSNTDRVHNEVALQALGLIDTHPIFALSSMGGIFRPTLVRAQKRFHNQLIHGGEPPI